ncbi:MAG: Holliday junction branch migration DNA helicase RuvB, partial [Thermotoga sp.]
PFTLIGATTRSGLLTSPLRNRFGMTLELQFYSTDELVVIVKRASHLLNIKISDEGAFEIAKRSRGTPRVANRLLRRIRDYAQVRAEGEITLKCAKEALALLGIDELGLDEMDRKILKTMIERYGGGPVGINTLAFSLGEEPDTISDVYEPYLLQQGLIQRTPRGRIVTDIAYAHVGDMDLYSRQEKLL